LCLEKWYKITSRSYHEIKLREVIGLIRIFIDQGHNPQNPNSGAEANGVREQDINYAIGKELEALLVDNGNFEVQLSRPTPETQLGSNQATNSTSSLRTRVQAANYWGADYFISLHCNANPNPQANGSEAYVYQRRGEAYPFAESILDEMTKLTGLRNRGVMINPALYVLRRTTMPAVLVEMGFITNPQEADLLESRPDLFAEGIYNGILQYFGLPK